jgi:hypothetical protein
MIVSEETIYHRDCKNISVFFRKLRRWDRCQSRNPVFEARTQFLNLEWFILDMEPRLLNIIPDIALNQADF